MIILMVVKQSIIALKRLMLNDIGVMPAWIHYGKKAFAKEGLDTLEVKKVLPECLTSVEQRISISNKDIEQANKLYNCQTRPIPSLCDQRKKIPSGRILNR